MTADEALALVVKHDATGIRDVAAGPALTEDDVDALAHLVDTEVFGVVATSVRRSVVFSVLPVTGFFRYADRFQIMPMPSEAPKLPQILGDHPFVLEVVHRSSDDNHLRIQRGMREAYAVNLLLSGLIPAITCAPPGGVQQRWAVRLGQEEARELTSEWVQLGYMFPSHEALADEMSSEPGAAIGLIASRSFYEKRGIRAGDVLELPLTLSLMLDRFYALDVEERDRFLRWAYWLNHAKQVSALSHSAYYVALIQAIEALRPSVSGPPCPSCGLRIGPGPTQQFVDFMERHVPRQDPETESERRELYRLRSALTHGGKLLRRDVEFTIFGGFEPTALSEGESSDRAAMITRLAGVDWLLSVR